MPDLTAEQAFLQARLLKESFNENSKMTKRLSIISRDAEPDLEAIGITPKLQEVVPWSTERPNQDAHSYATLLSLAKPTVEVFSDSEQPTKLKAAEKLEDFYEADIELLIPDDQDICRDMAAVGLGIRRLDEDARFFKDAPDRDDEEGAEDFNERVRDHRRNIGMPFSIVRVDPQTFYYEENRARTEVIFGVEWTRARESEVKEGGDFSSIGGFVVARTKDMIWHWWLPEADETSEPELVFEGPNRFGHTGYFLYRGRPTGYADPERRYDPFIEATLNIAQPLSLFMTLQAVFAVQAGTSWLESDLVRSQDSHGRAVSVERKTKGRGAQARTDHGDAAVEFEAGIHVRFRDLAGDYQAMVELLLQEADLYSPKDVLMGEAAADASGRAIIRLQEAAGRQLAPGYRARKLATEELLRVVRRTLFGRKEYLAGDTVNSIFIPRMVEGGGASGDTNLRDLIEITADDNIPHEIRVDVVAMSQAAQLAWIEEGRGLEGIFSRDTIDQDFYRIRNIPLENRRRTKDQVRAIVLPAAIEDGAEQALVELGKRPLQREAIALGSENGASARGEQGISGRETPPQTEDVGTAIGASEGIQPLAEG